MVRMEDAPNVYEIDADELTDADLKAIANERGYDLKLRKPWYKRFWVVLVVAFILLNVLAGLALLTAQTGSSGTGI
jgi:hypothetical protein